MMKRIFVALLALLLSVNVAQAIEVVRQKNVATYVTFPLIDSTDDVSFKSSATSPDSEIDAFADGSAPDGFADCTNEATEIGSTGVYYLSLTQSEMNNDYIVIQVKASDANTQAILIRTMVGDVANIATTDDGGAINVTSGKIDEVATLTGHTAQTGDSYAIVNSGTYGNSAIEGLVDDLETRLTADRAGYLDKLNVSGTLAHSDAAATYKATGFSTHSAADVKTAIEADGSKVDHLWETTEDDGGVRRFTENALEEAPSGSGVSDWSAAEKADILEALSVDDGTASETLSTIETQVKRTRGR